MQSSSGSTEILSQGFVGGLKQLVGGNIEAYAEVCEHARAEAYERMVQRSAELRAEAVMRGCSRANSARH